VPGCFDIGKIWFACEIMTWTGDHNVANSSSPVRSISRKEAESPEGQRKEGNAGESLLASDLFDLKGKAQPQTNRASVVYSFLRVADVVAAKVGIRIHVNNDELARLDINIEIAEQREGRIKR